MTTEDQSDDETIKIYGSKIKDVKRKRENKGSNKNGKRKRKADRYSNHHALDSINDTQGHHCTFSILCLHNSTVSTTGIGTAWLCLTMRYEDGYVTFAYPKNIRCTDEVTHHCVDATFFKLKRAMTMDKLYFLTPNDKIHQYPHLEESDKITIYLSDHIVDNFFNKNYPTTIVTRLFYLIKRYGEEQKSYHFTSLSDGLRSVRFIKPHEVSKVCETQSEIRSIKSPESESEPNNVGEDQSAVRFIKLPELDNVNEVCHINRTPESDPVNEVDQILEFDRICNFENLLSVDVEFEQT